jgi:hypothetical protein
MTPLQHEQIIQMLMSITNRLDDFGNRLRNLENTIAKLSDKTVVITDINKEVEQLKIKVSSLEDEKEV